MVISRVGLKREGRGVDPAAAAFGVAVGGAGGVAMDG